MCQDGQYPKIKAMHCVLCLMLTLSIQEIKAHHAAMVQMQCYVNTVYRVVFVAFTQMHTDTFLSITLLIFNKFSIQKKFWTAENQCFPTIPNIHACQYKHKISNAFNAMDVDTADTNKKKDNTLD